MDMDILNDELNNNNDEMTFASTTLSLNSQDMNPVAANKQENMYLDDFMPIPKLLIPKFSILRLPIVPKPASVNILLDQQMDEVSDLSSVHNYIANQHHVANIQKFNKRIILHEKLKERFSGHRGNCLLSTLVEMAGLKDSFMEQSVQKKIMIEEFGRLVHFSQKRNMRIRTNAQFNLLKYIRQNEECEEITMIIKMVDEDCISSLSINSNDRARAVLRYLDKKNKRKGGNFIRYESRQALAKSRVRTKGQFLSKVRIDIKEVAQIVAKKKEN